MTQSDHGVRIDATARRGATRSATPALIESLIANLLDNAIRHNVAGGVVEISTSVDVRRPPPVGQQHRGP